MRDKDIEVLEEFEETKVDFPRIAAHLGGTITEKEDEYEIHLGKEKAGIKVNGRDDGGLVFVAVMRSKKLFISNHIISGISKVKFSTVLAPRGKTKREVKEVVLQNEKGGIIIAKEGNEYIAISSIFADAEEKQAKGR